MRILFINKFSPLGDFHAIALVLLSGLVFYPVDRYFYPTVGRNMGKNGRNTFLPGRNGRNRVEMVETSLTRNMMEMTYFHIVSKLNLLMSLFL